MQASLNNIRSVSLLNGPEGRLRMLEDLEPGNPQRTGASRSLRQADQEGSANRSMRDNRRRRGRDFREEMDSSNDVIPHNSAQDLR
jgi:hypothetical protein